MSLIYEETDALERIRNLVRETYDAVSQIGQNIHKNKLEQITTSLSEIETNMNDMLVDLVPMNMDEIYDDIGEDMFSDKILPVDFE